MKKDREMTAEEVIDMQAEQCFNLAKQVHELIVGKDATIITVVLARTLAIVSKRTGIPRDAVVAQLHYVLNEVYGTPTDQETQQ